MFKNLHPCVSMPTLKTAAKIQQIQQEYLSLPGSAKSCYGTHRNFKTTRVRTRKKYFHLPIYLNPTCCSENLWLSSTLARKKSPLFSFSLLRRTNCCSCQLCLYGDAWGGCMKHFYKGWESFWTRPLPPIIFSHWSTAAAGSTRQVSKGCARRTVIYGCDAFLDVLPAPVM